MMGISKVVLECIRQFPSRFSNFQKGFPSTLFSRDYKKGSNKYIAIGVRNLYPFAVSLEEEGLCASLVGK